MLTLPNILSLFRIGMVPVLITLALHGQREAFLVALTASLASDIADGQVARRWGRCTDLGARLDSWGDLLTWLALLPGVALLWPAEIRAEATAIAIALASFVLPTAVGFAKFRTLTSYHTWGAKTAALLMGPGVIVLLGLGEPLLFRMATGVVLLSAIEELVITAMLREPAKNVRSAWHVRERLRRRGLGTR